MEFATRMWNLVAAAVTASDVILLLLRLTLIGAVGHLVLALLHRRAADTRHRVAVITLAVMLATPWLAVLGGVTPALRVPLPNREIAGAGTILRALEPADTPSPANSARTRASNPAHTVDRTDLKGGPETPESGPAVASRPARIPWHLWPAPVALIALLGALWLADLRLISLAATAWIAGRARNVEDPRLLRLLADAAASVGLTRTIEFRFTRHLSIPSVTVFPRTVLLLPEGAPGWSDLRLRAVLLHELAHVVRRDEIGFAIVRLATAALWFHPLAWTLARAARQECERACDDRVIGSGVRASDYADQLLAIARGATRSEGWSAMSLAFARPSSLEGRLLAILRADTRRAPLSRPAATALTLALVAALVPLAAIRVVAQPAAEDEPALRAAMASPQRWVDLGPVQAKSGEEWAEFGMTEYEAERYETAAEAYERAADAGYDPGMSWYRAAASFAKAGSHNRAYGALRAALDHGVDVGRSIRSDGDFDSMRSERRFRLMTQAVPGAIPVGIESSPSKEMPFLLPAKHAQSLPDDAQELKSEGIRELRNGDPDRAATLFLRQYALDSTAAALYNAACSFAVAGRSDNALAMLERSIHAGYGDADKLEDDEDLASIRGQSRFGALVRLAGDLELRFPEGKHRTDSEERSAWLRELPRYQRIARAMPREGRAWFNLGFAELRAGDPAASRDAYLQSLAAGYRPGTTHYNMACAEAQLGNDDAALRHLTAAEAAGMEVEQIAPGDDDLEPLRDNPGFRAMVDRWETIDRHEKKSKKDKVRTDG